MKLLNCFKTVQKLFNFENRLCRYGTSSILSDDRILLNEISCVKTIELKSKNLSRFFLKPETDEKLVSIAKEIAYALSKKAPCPEYVNAEQLQILYSFDSRSQRSKYLRYLFIKEIRQKSDQRKKDEKNKRIKINHPKHNVMNEKSHNECDFSKYGLGNKTLLINIQRRSINQFYNKRWANSVLFGDKIVIDLDYDECMVEKEKASCASQLRHIYSANRLNYSPYNLYFCNAKSNYKCVQYLKRDVPNIDESLITMHEESYLDLFPKESLVYLSPHADESLKFFDHSAIYIIGGFVDTVKKEKLSLNKALIEGIKSYSLPLDEYIQWKAGSKSLTINQVFEIMLTLKNTGNWKKALEIIPTRKVQVLSEEKEMNIKSRQAS